MSIREFIIELMSRNENLDVDCEEIVMNLLADIERYSLLQTEKSKE